MTAQQVIDDIENNLIPNTIPVPAMVGEVTRLQTKGLLVLTFLPQL